MLHSHCLNSGGNLPMRMSLFSLFCSFSFLCVYYGENIIAVPFFGIRLLARGILVMHHSRSIHMNTFTVLMVIPQTTMNLSLTHLLVP